MPAVRPSPIKSYVLEYNRPRGDDYRGFIRRLERAGLVVDRLPHKTCLRIRRIPARTPLSDFRTLLIRSMDRRRGSLMLSSLVSKRAWIMDNKGNRPGELVRIEA